MNAVRHAILARSVVVPRLEDPGEWESFRSGILESLEPSGGLENALAERIVEIQWRIRRVGWYERNEIQKNFSDSATTGWLDSQEMDVAGGRELPNLVKLQSIARYEAHLQRSLVQTMRELDRVQEKRRQSAGEKRLAGASLAAHVESGSPDSTRRLGKETAEGDQGAAAPMVQEKHEGRSTRRRTLSVRGNGGGA
jgi:hypothetical protein